MTPSKYHQFVYIYVARRIIEWNFCCTGNEEFLKNFWLYSWRRNWGVIIDIFYYNFYGFVNWNVSKKIFNIKWCRFAFVGWLGGGLEFRICMNLCFDLILYLFGIYGTIIYLRIFDMWYMRVGICQIIGQIVLPSLWVFILPYMYLGF